MDTFTGLGIHVLEWSEISRAAAINILVLGGEVVGFSLGLLAFKDWIFDLREHRKELIESIRASEGNDNVK